MAQKCYSKTYFGFWSIALMIVGGTLGYLTGWDVGSKGGSKAFWT